MREMNSQVQIAVELLKQCEDDSAIDHLNSVMKHLDRKNEALAQMLLWMVYAGDRKDWLRADAAHDAAVTLEPEYAKYNEEADRLDRREAPASLLCRELIELILEIYSPRWQIKER